MTIKIKKALVTKPLHPHYLLPHIGRCVGLMRVALNKVHDPLPQICVNKDLKLIFLGFGPRWSPSYLHILLMDSHDTKPAPLRRRHSLSQTSYCLIPLVKCHIVLRGQDTIVGILCMLHRSINYGDHLHTIEVCISQQAIIT